MSVLYLSNIVVNRFLIKDISSSLVSALPAILKIKCRSKTKVAISLGNLKTEATKRTRTIIDILNLLVSTINFSLKIIFSLQ